MGIVVSKQHYEELTKKYPAVAGAIDKEVTRLCEYYNKNPFKEKEKYIYNNQIKDYIVLINEEGIEEETPEKEKAELRIIYNKLIESFKEYNDLNKNYYPLLALWTIGVRFHNQFISYPFLFFNAMKGSGKTRLLKQIAYFCDGSMLNSLTEAVLFRTKDMLGIDEFEGLMKGKGSDNLRELLNSAYKKGTKVKRMKKVSTLQGENQVVEEFDVYRPIAMANIAGLESVLEDRSIFLVLEKSNNPEIINKAEVWEYETTPIQILDFLRKLPKRCSLCRCSVVLGTYLNWNKYLTTLTTLYTYTTLTTLTTPPQEDKEREEYFYKKLMETGIVGRNFELTFPLLYLSWLIGDDVFEEVINILSEMVNLKKSEDLTESIDVSLYDFISQKVDDGKWESIKDLLREFKQFIQNESEWLNDRWFGKALKRLNLCKEKKRLNYGVVVILDVNKAQDKIKMFKK